MKTSNKILIGLIAFIGFFCFCFLIYAKSQMVPTDQLDSQNYQIQASGNITKVEHNVDDFDIIEIGNHYEVFLSQGPGAVWIETDDNLQYLITPIVKGKTLSLKRESFTGIQNFSGFKIFITAEHLKEITATGFAKLKIDSFFQTESLFLKLSGSSEITFNDLNIDNDLRVIAGGFTKIKLSGSTEKLSLDLKESSFVDAFDFEAKKVSSFSSGFVKMKINAKDRLEINASGNSEIAYKGEPRINQKTRDFAKINQME